MRACSRSHLSGPRQEFLPSGYLSLKIDLAWRETLPMNPRNLIVSLGQLPPGYLPHGSFLPPFVGKIITEIRVRLAVQNEGRLWR